MSKNKNEDLSNFLRRKSVSSGAPAYKDPHAPRDAQMRSASDAVGGNHVMKTRLAMQAHGKGNGYLNKADPNGIMPDFGKKREDMDWDISDTPQEPVTSPSRRPPPVPAKALRQPSRTNQRALPGLPPKREATSKAPAKFNDDDMGDEWADQPTKVQRPIGPQLTANHTSPSGKWDVHLPQGGILRIPAENAEAARQIAAAWMKEQPGADGAAALGDRGDVDTSKFQVSPTKESSSGGVAGFQAPMGGKGDELREMIRQAFHEIVRKKEGGGGYVLYGPNKGKKKQAKPAGEFPTRLAAKRAELARFPPKDADQLKKTRKRIDKLTKDPKKRAEAEKRDLTGRKPVKKSRKSAGARKKATRESLTRGMAAALAERLFREEEIAGSPWDSKISNLSPDAVASDKRLAALHKAMHKGSTSALMDAHKGLAKAMRGLAKVLPGEIAMDDNRQKMYVPVMLDVEGNEVGPVHFYVDGGHVRCEVSQDCRNMLGEMDPDYARDIRGGLMSFQEDALPKIDHARKAWMDRDSYLDKLQAKLDKHVGGMSAIEVHLAKQLLARNRRKP